VRSTPFPSTPCDVAPLSVPEFTCELDLNTTVSLESACRRFFDDANRAVVWVIRFRALTGWSKREDVAPWLTSDPARARNACELAASFELNDEWEFDCVRFRSAVEAAGRDK
jgi:hypothetical protein